MANLLEFSALDDKWNFTDKRGEYRHLRKLDKRIIRHGESLSFSFLQRVELNKVRKIKRTIYYTAKGSEKVSEVASPEIVLY